MRGAFTLSLLALACFGTAASAADKREGPYQPPPATIIATPLALAFAGFDRDGDLLVSRAEADAGALQSFSLADSNRDGRVSLIELAEWSEKALGNRGALPGQFDFDRDGDDSISREEFIGLFQTRFAALDANKDGTLQRAELVSFQSYPSRRPARNRSDERGGPPQP